MSGFRRRSKLPDPEGLRVGTPQHSYTPMVEAHMWGDLFGFALRPRTWHQVTGWRRVVVVAGFLVILLFALPMILALLTPWGPTLGDYLRPLP